MSENQENKSMSMGITPKSFYSSSSLSISKESQLRRLQLKRKLERACENVKSKRMQDYILSDSLQCNEQGRLLDSEVNESVNFKLYRVFSKQNEALEFAERYSNSRLEI